MINFTSVKRDFNVDDWQSRSAVKQSIKAIDCNAGAAMGNRQIPTMQIAIIQ